MNYKITKKLLSLAFAVIIASTVFGQLYNCINTKEHPLVLEIIDSVKTNKKYRSMLAYAVINSDRVGLDKSTALNLAYAWAVCKKITDSAIRKNEEFKYLNATLREEEIEKLISLIGKNKY
jgi:hypothetical protein